MADDTIVPSGEAVPPIELLAAISSLLVHDLSNHISVIAANAHFAQIKAADSQSVEAAMKSILQSGERAAELLQRCGELRRSLKGAFEPGEVSDLRNHLLTCCDSCGWTADVPVTLTGRIAVPVYWVALAVREIIRETTVRSGTVSVAPGASRVPSANPRPALSDGSGEALEIRMTYQADHPFPFALIRSKSSNLALLAAYEMTLSAGGWANFERKNGIQQQPTLFVPMAKND